MHLLKLLIVVACAASVHATTGQPTGFDSTCLAYGAFYKYFTTKLSVVEAQAECRLSGGNLVEPQSTEEADCMINWLKSKNPSSYPWMGFNENGGVVTSQITGSTSTAINHLWSRGEPNSDDETCINIYSWGGVNDLNCASKQSFICEVRAKKSTSKAKKSTSKAKKSTSKEASSYEEQQEPQGLPAGIRTCANGVSYKLFDVPESYYDAADRCSTAGGSIAEPTSSTQLNCVLGLLQLTTHDVHSAVLGVTKSRRGARSVETTSGTDVSKLYYKWARGEPSGDGECIEMYDNKGLNDISCDNAKKPYVCQFQD